MDEPHGCFWAIFEVIYGWLWEEVQYPPQAPAPAEEPSEELDSGDSAPAGPSRP